ncbi:MAG: hypothetical protein ABI237_15355 [Ginsengibacter sp.]
MLSQHLKENIILLHIRESELEESSTKLCSVEEKWINNQMSFETYQRWYNDLTQKRMSLRAQISNLSQSQDETWVLLSKQFYKLNDMRSLYNAASTLQKQQIIRMGFDNRLYYQQQVYRTPYIMPIFNHNALILKEKNLLIIEEKKGFSKKIPSSGAAGIRTLVQTHPP